MSSLRTAVVLALAGSAFVCAEGRAQLTQHVFSGTATDGQFGHAVASAGDVNKDGIPDILVGEYKDADTGLGAGSAYVYSGADWSLLLSLHGSVAGGWFGFSVAGAGDVNGDGHDDVVIGAPNTDINGADTGSAQVFSGANGARLYQVNGTKAGEHFGYSVAGIGDVDGDLRSDFVVGAPDYDAGGSLPLAGRARVISGATGAIYRTFVGLDYQRMGWAVAGAGDVNGDQWPDLIIGVPGDRSLGDLTGRVDVISGPTGDVIFSRYGAGELASFGSAVAGVGDIDHDGFDDIVVGSFGEDVYRGSARVFRGPTGAPSWVFTGSDLGDQFGLVVDGAGDVDKDGTPDLVVGASPYVAGKLSFARVLSLGNGAPLMPDLTGAAGSSFGTALAHVGDVTADGWPDLVVGAKFANAPNGKKGTATVISPLVCQPDLGFGGPGVSKLTLCGTALGTGGKADLLLVNAPANKQALLVVSVLAANLPFKGGVLVPSLGAGLGFVLATNAQGKLFVPNVPGGLGAVDVIMQVIVQDPMQPKGYGLSNAISAHFLP